MSKTAAPAVTCLMVTRDRPQMAQTSIQCYLRQSYTPRNLVIVCESQEQEHRELSAFVSSLKRSDIRIVRAPPGKYSLGALRNISLHEADGDLVCQWDDDDFYHPDRVAWQVQNLLKEKCDACFLSDQLLLFLKTRSVYWCDWKRARRADWPEAVPNTVLVRRGLGVSYPETGELSRRSEDLFFMTQLLGRARVTAIENAGFLYIYVSHLGNTWGEDHHLGIVRITGLDAVELSARRAILTGALNRYRLPWVVTVRGFDGRPAFCYGEALPHEP